jgi:hypothetical protein
MHKSRKAAVQEKVADKPRWKNTDRFAGKTAVIGMLDRDQPEVRAAVVPNVKRETLPSEILSQIEYGSTLDTDQAVPYDGLTKKYAHEVVTHVNEIRAWPRPHEWL